MISARTLRFADWAPVLTGGEHAEAYIEDSAGTSLHFEDSSLQEIVSGSDRGVGLRYLRSTGSGSFETIYGALNEIDAGSARALADRLLAGVPRRSPPSGMPIKSFHQKIGRHPFDVSMDEKASLLKSCDKAVRERFPHIRQVSLNYAERMKRFAVLDIGGGFRLGERSVVLFAVTVTAEKDGLLQSGSEIVGALKGFEIFSERDPVKASCEAAARAVAKLSAPVAPAGEMPVVLAAAAGGTFIHEAIGHSLEADHIQEGTSPHYAGRRGQRVAAENVNIIDDPTLPDARGSYPFDDEGVPSAPTPLVENGILKDYLYDRLTGLKEGRSSNGHGRRESFRHRPIPRMSNLYVVPGKEDPQAIIRSVDKGLLVTRMGGGQVNTATGEFLFGVDEGYWVEGGEIRHLVRDANLLGTGPEVLNSIDRLGSDMGWGIGTCGKDGQGVPVSDGQPTLRIPKIVVGGR
ncbi:MAG: TldD/PmbA family protein [Elusimicrobiota bacterium]|jgi:TldD protein